MKSLRLLGWRSEATAPINLEIRSPDFRLTPAVRDYTKKHLAAKLSKHARAIHTVTVRFRDVNGSKGGEDKLCRVEVMLPGAAPQVVEEIDHDLRAAVDLAADRVERLVNTQIERRRLEPRQRDGRLVRALKLFTAR